MIRFGVIGTNRITEEFIKAAQGLEDFSLTAVYSRTEERAEEFGSKYGVSNIFTDIESMARSEELDAVYIASPNSLHAQHAIICMNHGKHVLCEKPIASNTKELQEMIKAAQTNKVVLMEALKSTLLPNYRAIQEHIYKIGKVRRYFASYCQYSSRYDAYKEGTVLNAFNPVFSNGSLMDLGVYCIYPMVVLFGRPDLIKATGVKLDSGVDGEGSLLLKYAEMDAVIMYSKITNSSLPSEIQGENGSMVIDKINTPEKVEIRYRNGSIEEITKPQDSKTMVYEVKEFIELIHNGRLESLTNSFANSLIAMEIMDEARKQIGLVYPADTDN
ncbi:oxidoreductase [Paenibacillus sp. LMG 31456]|uniref:Oxidoreductase n=1 Tax=Paenibacillus foliorum TaxID=2654974 RepID=A0A972GYT6_9BACL|nr:Gfo/Idh/MocA family oxidoreductase [Paenibacillus foliorum]NOU96302.1 oxidoreductase [Paenibacillus foliorum]